MSSGSLGFVSGFRPERIGEARRHSWNEQVEGVYKVGRNLSLFPGSFERVFSAWNFVSPDSVLISTLFVIIDHQVLLAVAVQVCDLNAVCALDRVVNGIGIHEASVLGRNSVNTNLFSEEFSGINHDRIGENSC